MHAEVEGAIRDLEYGVGLNHFPSGHFGANAAWLWIQAMAYNICRWLRQIGDSGWCGYDSRHRKAQADRNTGSDHPLGKAQHPAPAMQLALGGDVPADPPWSVRTQPVPI